MEDERRFTALLDRHRRELHVLRIEDGRVAEVTTSGIGDVPGLDLLPPPVTSPPADVPSRP